MDADDGDDPWMLKHRSKLAFIYINLNEWVKSKALTMDVVATTIGNFSLARTGEMVGSNSGSEVQRSINIDP